MLAGKTERLHAQSNAAASQTRVAPCHQDGSGTSRGFSQHDWLGLLLSYLNKLHIEERERVMAKF